MSKIGFKEFGSYIDSFTSLVSEFECVGGNRTEPLIQSLFMSNIPEKYNSEKNTYEGKKVDEAIEYFTKIHAREKTYCKSKNTESNHLKAMRMGQRRFLSATRMAICKHIITNHQKLLTQRDVIFAVVLDTHRKTVEQNRQYVIYVVQMIIINVLAH